MTVEYYAILVEKWHEHFGKTHSGMRGLKLRVVSHVAALRNGVLRLKPASRESNVPSMF